MGSLSDRAPPRVHPRFDRLARLYGEQAVARLGRARVVVFGVGGVGSFAAEALVRSAVGHVMLVDSDDVCVTNTNRQLQADSSAVGKPKAVLLCERLRQINPEAKVEATQQLYDADHAEALLTAPWPGATPTYDYVIDCIDKLTPKAHLIATCRERDIPLVCATGAGGKTDPTRIRVADLGRTDVCQLAHQLRKMLRQKHGFPRGRARMGILAVYSEEPRRWPTALSTDGGASAGEDAEEPRSAPEGTAVFVTGAFGLACASLVVNALARGQDLATEAETADNQISEPEDEHA